MAVRAALNEMAIGGADLAADDVKAIGAANLPDLVLDVIFLFLPIRDILNCAGVCQRWRQHLSSCCCCF